MNNEVKAALDSNPNITEEVKENILELTTIFTKVFPDVNLSNFISKLKTLKIQRESMYLVKLPCQYNPFNNVISINLGRLENSDTKHWLMHSLLGVITAKDNYYGFNKNDKLFALNLGFTEMLANTLVGNDGICDFEEEVLATNLISKLIGREVLFNAYFNNDAELVLKKMLEAEAQ